ncbi:MAG: aminoglycoside phosphotransferase family protein [Anaerolineae bacterium]|nr:aminoglycoside phosphotransferase family protein [Anaerolineae bacterium]
METTLSLDLLPQLLRQTFGAKVELHDYRIGNQHHDYLVLLAQLQHPSVRVVIKLAGPEAPLACPFDRTAMLHKLVATHTTVPMPEVLAVNVSYRDWPWRYFIKTHIPGVEWAAVRPQLDEGALSGAYRQIGDAVAQLHSIHFPMFGELVVDGSVRGDGSFLVALAERVRHSVQSVRLRDLFFAALERRRDLFMGVRQAGLCHEDLHKYNLLFQQQQGQWRLATILDFDKAWAGHHESDLARLELWEGTVSETFWQSYEALCPLDPLYTQRRPLYQFLWCLEYAQPTTEHLADTQRLCAELGLPPLERFD